MLGLGSPTYPLARGELLRLGFHLQVEADLRHEFLYSGPLFTHQFSHIWIDFRGIQDAYMRERGIDYFENSRRATYVQQAVRDPQPAGVRGLRRALLGDHGQRRARLDGPLKVDGIERHFFDYIARGVPYGPDDGTIAPWAVVASLPVRAGDRAADDRAFHEHGSGRCPTVTASARRFNRTFTVEGSEPGWVSPYRFGIDQGPIVLMIENYRSGLLWKLMRRCPAFVTGLRRAGFTSGWL